MKKKIDLPDVKSFDPKLGHEHAWSDQYGAFHVAADYCNLSSTPAAQVIWQHGCFGPWDQVSAETIIYNAPNAKNKKIFVAREDEAELLKQSGYKNSYAIGLPLVYLKKVEVKKIPRSLLVVPVHTIAGMNHFQDPSEMKSYARYINSYRNCFDLITVCVHAGCVLNGNWINQFKEYNIDYIEGANSKDANALKRVMLLFSQYEYVTTNGWGSHVAYALYCGAKVSISGPRPTYDFDIFIKDSGHGGYEQAARRFCATVIEQRNDFLRGLFLTPNNGIANRGLGSYLIGAGNRKSPRELQKLFNWNPVLLFVTQIRNSIYSIKKRSIAQAKMHLPESALKALRLARKIFRHGYSSDRK